MNQKTIKILSMIFTLLGIVVFSANIVLAAEGFQDFSGDTTGVDTDALVLVGKKIVGILQIIGMLVSVVILIVLGIKYMMGSAEEKASYKKTMIPYVVGAVLVFGASTFAEAIYDFAIGLQKQ